MKKIAKKRAFSLIELSIVLVIIALLATGVIQSSGMIHKYKIRNAQITTLNSPISSISGLVLWLEPTLENAFSQSVEGGNFIENDDEIATWFDVNPQNSQKNNFSASASQYKPQYVSNGIGDLPSVYFDKTTLDHLTNDNGVLMAGDTSYTIITVSKISDENYNSSQNYVFSQGNSSSACQMGWLAGISYYMTSYGHASCGNDYFVATQDVLDKGFINGVIADGESVRLFTNSSAPNSTTLFAANLGPESVNSVVGGAPNAVSDASTFGGQISEVIIFDRAIKQDEMVDILKYLSKKYKISLSETPAAELEVFGFGAPIVIAP